MTVGALAAIVLLTGRIIQPVLKVEAFLAGMENVRQDRADLEDILALPQLADGPGRLARIDRIDLMGITTQPAAPSGLVFRNLDLTLERGECVAISGSTKLAKSAFLHLLLGEVPLQKGQVLFNGRPDTDYRLEHRQERMRYLSPENSLIEGTLIDNMTLFQPRVYRDRAIELAQEIGIEKPISQSPDGFSLRVGPGAKAVLPKSLADAALIVGGLVTDPDVLLFDEANAALDRELDQKLLEILRAEKGNRITLMVSNRPSYLKIADRVIDISEFLEGGPSPRPESERAMT